MPSARYFCGDTPVPRDFDIFSPDAVMKPCTNTFVGVLRPEKCSVAGQNSVWK